MTEPLQIAAYLELVVSWVVWFLAFVKPRKQAARQKKVVRDAASRWGLVFNGLGFGCVCAYVRPEGFRKSFAELIASMVIAPLAIILVWSATRHLGRHWRFEAALSQDHALVKTGAYAWLRHPIYTSMLAMILATGLGYSWWPLLVLGILLFLFGIEIRVRAYLPFIR
ncbi:MAG: isoprenylcysteine carboxylmethyltransferase family protein [Terracidiphilus sp.]